MAEHDGHYPHAATTLGNRTYLGLLAAQFLAAFNDQAIHAAAMFYAINTQTLSEANAISLMPILFYAPWAIFCTLAGYLADRYSKRNTIVFWKIAEVFIAALALFGFWLGSDGGMPAPGAWVVLSCVFLMGMHSAFFVPAKYGIMPEILHTNLLSKGNGILESLSFLAVILGTVSGGVLSFIFLSREANIGIVLLVLAIIGAFASLMVKKIPAANNNLPFPPYLYGPLFKNLKVMFKSKPLVFAVIGIAFFTFIVAFMRATVYMFGESQNPRWDELKTSAVVGTVALGVGLGSPLAGYLSGRRVELGFIPLGALGMIIGCVAAGFSLGFIPGLIACTILIGICTGFYLVPLFTLLQYRAPKSSKGDMVATSNFINVTGAIAASILFAVVVLVAKKTELLPKMPEERGIAQGTLTERELLRGRAVYVKVGDYEIGTKPSGEKPKLDIWDHLFGDKPPATLEIELDRNVDVGEEAIVDRYEINGIVHYTIRELKDAPHDHVDARKLPRFLFLGAGAMTLGVILILIWRLRDLPSRAKTLLERMIGERYQVDGLSNIPGTGRLLLHIPSQDRHLIHAMTTSVDRLVVVFHEATANNLAKAKRALDKGDVIAFTMTVLPDGLSQGLGANTIPITYDHATLHFGVMG